MEFFKKLLKNPFKKTEGQKKLEQEASEAVAKIVTRERNKINKKYKKKESCEIQGSTLKIGDKIICRSNEPYPLMVGKIIEFWDNEGKWSQVVPVVRESRTGKKFNVHGIVRPYSKELMDTLQTMKPLEQWNYFVPEESKYSKEEMENKEKAFENRKKFLPKKK